MPPQKRADFVRPVEAATGDIDGEPFVLNPNEIYAADHPVVRKHPRLFRPLEADRARPSVEQATAAPGERR